MKHIFSCVMNRLDKGLRQVLEWICIALYTAITIILSFNIFVRFVPIMSMHWFDEILELLYGAMIFYGAALVWIIRGHFSVGDWISKHLKSKHARFVYRLIVELMSLVFIAIFFNYALDLMFHTEESRPAIKTRTDKRSMIRREI